MLAEAPVLCRLADLQRALPVQQVAGEHLGDRRGQPVVTRLADCSARPLYSSSEVMYPVEASSRMVLPSSRTWRRSRALRARTSCSRRRFPAGVLAVGTVPERRAAIGGGGDDWIAW